MRFFPISEKAKYAASRLPSNWPSHLHNKCTVPSCYFPNSPQAAGGTYNCRGYWRGSYCKGTYYVSPSTAASVTKNYRTRMAREDQAKWRVQKAAEIERQKVVKDQLDEEVRRLAAEELAAKYEEKRRVKDTSTGSTADNLPFSSYLARRAAQQRRPANTKPTDLLTEQQHHGPSAYNQVDYLTSSRSQGSKSATRYPSALYEYSSPQYHHTETQTYNYQHGKSHSRF